MAAKRITIFAAAVLSLTGAALLLPLTATSAQAQDAKSRPAPRKAKGSMTESGFRQIEKVQKLIVEGKNDEALAKINEVIEKLSGAYDKAIALQTKGYILAGTNKYKEAIKVFEECLATDAFPQQAWEQMLLNIAQLYAASDMHEKAITSLQRYFDEAYGTINAEAYILMASLLAEKKRYSEALPFVDKALAQVSNPKESWLQLKLAVHFELKQYAQCAEVLIRLIALAPVKEDYWKQLSSVLFEIKNDKDSLAVLALAERQGFINEEKEFRNLANVYLLMDIPYKAGQLLQRGIDGKQVPADEKALQTLSDSWIMAREYSSAEKSLRQLAELANKGDNWFRLAQVYVEQENWTKALDTLEKAQTRPGLTKEGEVAFLAGVAAFNIKDNKRARENLQRALKHEETRKNATDWLAHIGQQEEAERVMAQLKEMEEERKKQEAEEKAKMTMKKSS